MAAMGLPDFQSTPYCLSVRVPHFEDPSGASPHLGRAVERSATGSAREVREGAALEEGEDGLGQAALGGQGQEGVSRGVCGVGQLGAVPQHARQLGPAITARVRVRVGTRFQLEPAGHEVVTGWWARER